MAGDGNRGCTASAAETTAAVVKVVRALRSAVRLLIAMTARVTDVIGDEECCGGGGDGGDGGDGDGGALGRGDGYSSISLTIPQQFHLPMLLCHPSH